MTIFISSIYSLTIILLPLTIPTIVFTGLSIKRSYFLKNSISKKIVPVILNIILLSIIIITFSLFLSELESIIVLISDSFFNKVPLIKELILDVNEGFLVDSFLGKTLTLYVPIIYAFSILLLAIGWHWTKELKLPVEFSQN